MVCGIPLGWPGAMQNFAFLTQEGHLRKQFSMKVKICADTFDDDVQPAFQYQSGQ